MKLLGKPIVFKLFSLFFILYICIPGLVNTRSWWETFNSVLLFVGIWGLGHFSADIKPAPLTDEQVKAIVANHRLNVGDWSINGFSVARSVEQAHRIAKKGGA